jgi:hypothetical protein
MSEKSPVFVGVEILRASGRLRRAFVYAALDAQQDLIAIGHGDRNEILAYLGGQGKAFAAVNAPRRPNMGAAQTTATHQEALPFNGKQDSANTRVCEIELQNLGFPIQSTPAREKNCSRWMRRGFDLFRRLAAFGYASYTHDTEAERFSLETQADAIFWQLLDKTTPLPDSLEGRLQRQLILYDLELPVPDAMDFFLEITRHKLMQGDLPLENIYTFSELNALAAAYVAWLAAHQPEDILCLGHPDEGWLILPAQKIMG